MKFVVTLTIALLCFTSEVWGDTVCWNGTIYEDLGCFTNDPPYDNTNFLPEYPGDINTGFWLYTRENPDVHYVVSRYDPPSLGSSTFDQTKLSKFIIHGFGNSGEAIWIDLMKDEFLLAEDLNVFAVDWEDGASAIYGRSVTNTMVVGAEIDAFVQYLDDQIGYTEDMVHLIGHSLGAHVGGHAGERMESLSRISGMDPAGPNYRDEHTVCRLDDTDAKFVDAIHTDGDRNGIFSVSGHADFYPNGGISQTGCPDDSCDHSRVHDYYIASITDCLYEAYPCDDIANWENCTTCNSACSNMGYHADPFTHGTFTLTTTGTYPFC